MDGVCGMEEASGGFMGQMTRAAATGGGLISRMLVVVCVITAPTTQPCGHAYGM
jgi:hypothetical protein